MSFLSLLVYKYNLKSKKHLNNYSRKRLPMASSNTRNFYKIHQTKCAPAHTYAPERNAKH